MNRTKGLLIAILLKLILLNCFVVSAYAQSGQPIYHTVQPQETLYRISVNYKTTIDNISRWNSLSDNNIFISQKLIVGYEEIGANPTGPNNSNLSTNIDSSPKASKQVHFFGYGLFQYKYPVQIQSNYYEPYFENMGENLEQGRIIIDELNKTFTIKWIDGEDWICKFLKKESLEENDEWFGNVMRIIYTGKWDDTGDDAQLMITVTTNSGCVTALNSRKVIDSDYGIDTWKKTFAFATEGECFNE